MNDDQKKHLLLQKLLTKKRSKTEEDAKIQERIKKTEYPLSMVQRGIWMDCLIDPDSAVYNIPFACRIKGPLQIDAMKEGIRRIIARHDTWRTVICRNGEDVFQKIKEEGELDFRYFDKRGEDLTEGEIAEEGKRFVSEPIDLENGPLVRFSLYQTEDELFYFVLCGHHLVYDGPSENLFCEELSKEYSSVIRGEASPIEDPKICYGDYAEDILAKMKSKEIQSQIEYWKEELTGIDPTEFPTDHVRPALRSSEGGMIYFDVPKETEKKIREYAASRKVTVNIALFSVLNCLLQLYTRSEDISVEITVANRDEEEMEKLLGCFINNLIIVTEMHPEMTFDEVVEATKEKLYSALGRRDVPLETLVEAVNPPRDLSRTPFSEIGFNYNPRSRMELFLDNCTCEAFGLGDFVVLSDVNFQIHDAESLYGFVEYNRSLYEKETIERILSLYLILMDKLPDIPGEKIGNIEAVSDSEKKKILTEFNLKKASCPTEKTVVELFEEQVKKTPENIAVVFENERITYRELNEKANRLAHLLRENYGVRPGDFVAVICERSIEMITAIYGVLKSGGAYLPIDPTYPEDRISYMLSDASPKAVITYQAEVSTSLPVIDLGKDDFSEKTEDPEHIASGEDRAYCIYTSGTTGEAKGVLIRHRNLASYVLQFIDYYRINEHSVILQQAYIGFDTSVEELYPALLSGGRIVVVDKEHLLDAERLKKTIIREGIDLISCSPLLIKEMDYLKETKVRTLISGGDVLKKEYFENLRDSDISIYNTYGPTEGTVCATYYKIDYKDENINIPIGRPIFGAWVYILNHMSMCAVGVPGELCIAGSGVAEGYLNRPDLTAEKFIADPFFEGKMYRTGDLARWLPDGNIEYLGRIDEQVKIRGFRVELGEIESRILTLSGIKDCAVIARTDASGEKAIYAYYVTDQEISISDVRDHIAAALPEYMVPSYLMRIDALPVNRSGKLDKRALPEIEAKTDKEYIAPRNETEKIICRIFSDILNCGEVGIKDSFFALGGHSLRATRLLNRIEEETGKRIALKDIFSRPTPEQLAEIVNSEGEYAYSPIPKAEEKEYYPMSSAQKRTYLVCQLDPNGILYNMPESYRIEGEVDPDALKNALQTLIDRHEILRTQFLMVDGEPVQKILPHADVDFEFIKDETTEEADLIGSFTRPFDLSSVPLFRVQLIDRGDHYLFNMDTHHIIGDGMSSGTFIKELNTLYNGGTLPPLTHQFKDYSEWMRSRDLSGQKAYWTSQFDEEIPVLDMPLDFVRPQEQSYKGAMLTAPSGKDLARKIRELSSSTGSTEFMVFLSAAMVLLSKYSRQEDVVIGSPISGRTHKDTEEMLGMFVNTLAMRGQPEGKKTYREFLSDVKKICLKAYENQEYPFEELVEAVDVERDLSRNPLFDVMLVLQNNEEEKIRFGSSEVTMAETKDTIAKIDLSFDIWEEQGEYIIGMEYCTDLFRKESAQKILSHFLILLQKLTESPEERLADVEMLDDTEREQVLVALNATETEYPKEKTVVEQFEEQVEKTPDHDAVVFEGEKLTYRELDEKAARLAATLRGKYGVGPGDFVAMLTERSVEMLVGIFGILKAGGAYVPMDPTYPEDRIAYMLSDAAPKAILTYKTKISTNIPVIDLERTESYSERSEKCTRESTPEDLCYCIYTSGTTGRPKGVLIENRGVCNLVTYLKNALEVDENDHVLWFSNYIFDGSVFEMLLSVMNGATLFIPTDETVRDIDAMRRYVAENEISVSYFPPQYYEQGKIALSKYIITAGSAASMSVVRSILQNCHYINSYGPTEATVCISNWIVEKGQVPENVTIGKPVQNAKVYIVQGNTLCGIGVPGELCVSGAGLARGYLNRPDLTAEKFVENPFGEGRMYHTGDLARWLPDGNIEYLGRIDEQVKIRGYRVELGEIDSKIREIEEIKDCAVIARNDISGEKAIYAYLVSEKEIRTSEVRDILSGSLPDYMIPSYMMRIDSIPMTRNGKLDKRALPEIEAKTDNEYVAPKNETEAIICDIFSEILHVEKVSVKDSFFALSGHSLRATRLVNRIEEMTGKRLPLKSVFSSPTPEKLAELVNGDQKAEFLSIPHAEEKEYYPMSSSQKRTYLISQMDPDSILYNMPEHLILRGTVHPEKLQHALQTLIDRHEILRTQFLMVNGEPVQKILPHVDAFFSYRKDPVRKQQQIIDEFVKPFDISHPPLVRVQLIDRGDHHLLSIDMHHIVGDGMSVGTFTRELNALYNGEELPVLTHQFKDYSEWMSGRDLSAQALYWKRQFLDSIPVLDMPLDYIRPQEQSTRGSMVFLDTGTDLGRRIRELSQKSGTTEFMVLLSAAMVLLSKYSRQDDIVIGTPISGRTHKDTEGMLGMFINTLAMRGRPEGKKTYLEFLSEIRETCLRAYENQEYPFEELLESVDVVRDMSRNPLFDVMLILQNNENEEIRFAGVQAEYADAEDYVAKFDLTFNIGVGEDDYQIGLEYCTDLFTKKSAELILTHYLEVLNELTGSPEKRIEDVRLISECEKAKITKEFNDTDTEYPRDMTVVTRFEEQVRKTPEAVAAVYGEESLTYRELNERANQLAHTLREKYGVGPDDFVAMFTERSMEMLVGLYAVLKAGGAYVPMDPAYPKERTDYMLSDAKPKAILTYQAKIDADVPVLPMEDPAIYSDRKEDPEHVNGPEDLMYCIYTSGTTGRPKGVMIKHRNVVNYSQVCEKSTMAYAYEKNLSRFVSVTNMVFDIFVTEAVTTLCNGLTVYIAKSEEQSELDAFEKLVRRNDIEILQTTPSRIKGFFAQDPETKVFSGMKYIMLGGEAVTPDVVARLHAASDAVVENVYGPSETTVWSTCFTAERDALSIPIGSPICNTQIYIVDKDNLCGIGVPGELCIAGEGLARGYLNRPDLTEEKFVKNPFGEGRMYHTGDLARWLPDGNIEYLGRIDEQVKVRGFRIELGEIDSRIREIEDINDCAVIVRSEASGDKAIYAYLVSDKEMDLSSVRDALAKTLPEYMVPSYFAQIGKIPVNRNGKLDKRALPDIEAKAGIEYVAPRNELERTIASVFEEMLGIEKAGINDNIFELGGNSLKIIRISSKLKLLNIPVSTKDLHTHTTIAQLSELLGASFEDLPVDASGKADTSKIAVTMFEPQVLEGKKIVNDSVLEAIEKYKHNLDGKNVVKSFTPNYMQNYYLHLSVEDTSIIGVCLNVSGVSLSDLKTALTKMVMDQSALRTCYSDETGKMTEYGPGAWEIPYITASRAESRQSVSTCLFKHEVKGGTDILPVILIAGTAGGDLEVYIAANHALWDRSSCDIVSDLLETYLKDPEDARSPDLSYSDYVIRRGSSGISSHEKESQDYIHRTIDAYKARSAQAYVNKAFSVTLKRKENEKYDVAWLMGKFSRISDTENLSAIPFFMLYHCRDEKSVNTLGYYIDYVPCVFDKEKQEMRFYDEAIRKLEEGSADYRFLCDEYAAGICDDIPMVNLKESIDDLKREDIGMIEIYDMGKESAQEGIECCLDGDLVYVGMGFHMQNVSDEEFMERIQKAFSIL